MGKILGLTQCPVFLESGDVYQSVPYGADIPDYPTKGQAGDHWGNDITRYADGKTTTATIVAIEDGVIYAQRKYVKGFDKNIPAGNCVFIRHTNGMVTKYYHLKYGTVPDWIKDDVPVKKGQILGYMGSTGYSYGAHLHFQVEDANGKTIDPEPYLHGEKTIIPSHTKKYHLALTAEFDSESDAQKMQDTLKAVGIETDII